jgi:hypothetical protein
MIRRLTTVLAFLVIVGGAARLYAHDEFRIIGTLDKHQNSTIVVTKNTGKTLLIRLDEQTMITQDKKKVARSALKAGQSLVIDAYGDQEENSLALEIRIVPAIGGKKP